MHPPAYRLLLARPAEKHLRRLTKTDRQRIGTAIGELAEDPRPRGCQKLVALEGYRIRVGIFRITYGIDDDAREVTIYSVLRRKDAYR
jgi:mRNA interferase RelE/StbE